MMHDEPHTVREFWVRHLSNEGLTSSEQTRLRESLANDEQLRRQLLADERLHRSLQAISVPTADTEEFVNDVLARCLADSGGEPPLATLVPPPIAVSPPPPVRQLGSSGVETVSLSHRQRRSDKRVLSMHPFIAIASSVLIFVLGGLAGFLASRQPAPVALQPSVFQPTSQPTAQPSVQPSVQPSIQPSVQTPLPPPAPVFGVATLTSSDFGSWDRPRLEGSRLPPGKLRLEHGRGVIAMDNGTLLQLDGPTEIDIDSQDKFAVQRGSLTAIVPPSARGVSLRTPSSEVIGQGAEINLAVSRDGASDIFVRDGSVTLQPWGNRSVESPLVLTASDMNRATVWQPAAEDARSPRALVSRGEQGKFSGRISINGRTLEFDSPEAFETARQRVGKQFIDSADQLVEDWNKTIQRYGNGLARGEFSVNGVQVEFDNLAEAMELQRELVEATQHQLPHDGAAGGAAFQGMININGEVRTFSSAEEFQQAQRDLFGPLQTLDLGFGNGQQLPDLFKQPPRANAAVGNPFLPRPAQPLNQ